MISARFKARLQVMLNRLGYRIERLRPTSADPFDDQATILWGAGLVPTMVFDLGAHFGTTVARYRALFPGARIFAFEPFADSFAQLRDFTASDPGVRPINSAVSDRDGLSRLYLFHHEQANSLLPVASSAGRYYDSELFVGKGAVEVPTVTLDRFCKAEGVPNIDILKMDVQGAELPVLHGARDLLAGGRVALIYSETEFAQVYEGQATFYEIREYLAKFGYDMFNLYSLYRGKDGRLVAADAIFLRGDLIEALNSAVGRA
jgi:FkbM family methyltransferase